MILLVAFVWILSITAIVQALKNNSGSFMQAFPGILLRKKEIEESDQDNKDALKLWEQTHSFIGFGAITKIDSKASATNLPQTPIKILKLFRNKE